MKRPVALVALNRNNRHYVAPALRKRDTSLTIPESGLGNDPTAGKAQRSQRLLPRPVVDIQKIEGGPVQVFGPYPLTSVCLATERVVDDCARRDRRRRSSGA